MELNGKNGILRIYDGSKILHGAAPLSGLVADIVTFDGGSTWTNITSQTNTDDSAAAENILPDNAAVVFIGSTSKFAMYRFLKGIGSDYAVGSGVVIGRYFNGINFNTSLPGLADGTELGGDCFARDGYGSFQIPRNWVTGADSYYPALDNDKYYIALMTTTSSSTDFGADVLCPVDAQYFDVKFAGMDFNGPSGRSLAPEQLILNRGRVDEFSHYIKGADDVIYQALQIGSSCLIDDIHNRDYVEKALACDNPNAGTWTGMGITAKGTTKNDGINYNPPFTDANKKAVNIQMIWTGEYPLGMAYYEAYYPPEMLNITESDDGIMLNMPGGVFGVIERIYGFGVRY